MLIKYNLTKEQLNFEDSAIQEIIKNYTWEAGVRNLGKKLENIFSEFSSTLLPVQCSLSECISKKELCAGI